MSVRETTPCFIARSTSTLSRLLVLVQVNGSLQNSPPTYKLSRFPWPIKYALILERAYPFDSRFHPPAWQSHLKHYEDNKVVEFLTFGWPNKTLPYYHQIHSKIMAPFELLHIYGVIVSTYQYNPFTTTCVISPLQCVPKRDATAPRIVHDLSFPPGNCTQLIPVFPLTVFITSLTS